MDQEEDFRKAENNDLSEEVTDADKIKVALKNSSKVYYKITHSVTEEIDE